MPSSGMLHRMSHVRIDVSEERSASIIRLVRRLLVTAPSSQILFTLMMEALRSSETLVLTGTTGRNIPEDDIVHGHRRENLKSYKLYSFGCNWSLCSQVGVSCCRPLFFSTFFFFLSCVPTWRCSPFPLANGETLPWL
jgi:hypothetical protein